MLDIRISRPDEGAQIVAIWKSSVDATHQFLKPEDRLEIEKEVIGFFQRLQYGLL